MNIWRKIIPCACSFLALGAGVGSILAVGSGNWLLGGQLILVSLILDGLDGALARLLRPLRVKVNLIPMNPIDASQLRAPQPEQVAAFRERLADSGYSCFVRTRRGDDVSAACGQLAMRSAEQTVPERALLRKDRAT